MAMMDIHGCVDCVREHFYKADYLQLVYTLPLEAYSLNRSLQYRICGAWDRFKNQGTLLSPRECILLAEAWLIAAPSHTKPMYVNAGWTPPCAHCGKPLINHDDHPENNPKNNPRDRWVCEDGKLYEPKQYKDPQSGRHPSDAEVNASAQQR